MNAISSRPRVIIIGGGFGGLFAAREFRHQPVDVLMIDRQNFHTFTPLLYQVATCGLEAEEIAYPLRAIFQGHPNIQFLLGEVTHIDAAGKQVMVQTAMGERAERYDALIVAAGSVTNYFGVEGAREHGFELKALADATRMRNHLLQMFELAAWTDDPAEREAMTTIVVVGGGPSGVETAGAIRELITNVLSREYPFLQRTPARVILMEAVGNLLSAFPRSLQESALRQVRSLGVEVRLNTQVTDVAEDHITLKSGETVRTRTLIWMAGIAGAPLGNAFGLPLAKGNRVEVLPTMQVDDLPDVYVVGDLSSLTYRENRAYAQLIPPAKQQGILAARNILARGRGQSLQTFRYQDRGIMATIGRRRAVAYIFNLVPLSGRLAWLAWLGLHLVTLMGFRNRINVLINWLWNYFTYDRSVRLIFEDGQPGGKQHIAQRLTTGGSSDGVGQSDTRAAQGQGNMPPVQTGEAVPLPAGVRSGGSNDGAGNGADGGEPVAAGA